MEIGQARRRVLSARIGHLGTVSGDGRPHLVPCCFVLRGDTVYSAVDAKPKSTMALRRVENIMANGAACLLVDHYEEDWSALWWIRLDGVAHIVDSLEEVEEVKGALAAKYPQYRQVAIPGPVIALDIRTWRAWP
jgi:PPOX class probable F420-dependent enzyme